MEYLLYLRDFVACFFAVFFFGIIMSAPKRSLIPSSLAGTVAYLLYRVIYVAFSRELLGYLVASVMISLLSELLARKLKMPSTVFILPGIIPLVPGVGLYKTMLCLINNDASGLMTQGSKTLFISGIIAVSIAVVNVMVRHNKDTIRK